MISGQKVTRPTKRHLVEDIAGVCGIPAPLISSGSSVDSAFVEAVHQSLVGEPTGVGNAYRKVEKLLGYLGRPYDPYWDTSEVTETGGGGTVTARAFSRIRTSLTGTPRCFIINVTDAPVGARWETDHHRVYRYDDTVTGRLSLNDAGPESQILYYATSNSSVNRMSFIARATVGYISPGWTGPWEVRLTDYQALATPVPVSQVDVKGWNRQHSITEIDFDLFEGIVTAGGPSVWVAVSNEVAQLATALGSETESEADDIAARLSVDFGADRVDPLVVVPLELVDGRLTGSAPVAPTYAEVSDDRLSVVEQSLRHGRGNNSSMNRQAELRAVALATAALETAGWTLSRDRQSDGVGYDLEFRNEKRLLKVEIKGIQGPDLVFNVTPKEYWRAERDPHWVLVAVTSVLSPRAFGVHLLTRDQVVSARRVVTGYRLTM